MHLSVRQSQALDADDDPVDPDQSPAEILYLSFTDSDLACMAAANADAPEDAPSLCLTSLARLKHPMSVDLYVEQLAVRARVIVARVLGGLDWWRYGGDQFARIAREQGITLILVPGDAREDDRLRDLSTAAPLLVDAVNACLAQGGVNNAARVLVCLRALAQGETPVAPQAVATAPGALYRAINPAGTAWGAATILFYRAHAFAADAAPIDALLAALAARGLSARAFMVTSLKDPAALAALRADLRANPADIVLDATAFAAGETAHPLADCAVPILQIALANTAIEAWQASPRGLGPSDLAMHVALPESDGRVFTRAISFKSSTPRDAAAPSPRTIHQPVQDRVEFVADLSAHWAKLGKTPASQRKIAMILSDYPDRAGRRAYAVGLDGPQSAVQIARLLSAHGHDLTAPRDGPDLMTRLDRACQTLALDAYRARFDQLPTERRQQLTAAWGAPEQDAWFHDGAFHLPILACGKLWIALQPDRGSALDRKAGYHDAATPPRHGYLAFYWWLRDIVRIDAMIHLGTHGNLEWLPGKSVALGAECWPEIVLGPLPVLYPYIISDPGEAAQAKRRIAAVALGHLTPPLMPVALSPGLAELEALVDEYGGADGLDGRRMTMLRAEILDRARTAGLPGANDTADENQLMTALESHLCDIKEQRVGNGLHVFGQSPADEHVRTMAHSLAELAGDGSRRTEIAKALVASSYSEQHSLISALDGKFVSPGPGGSPVRGRLDILPTGRNMITVDPRAIPTRTATVIGHRAAAEFVRRYTQDHGDWPRAVMIDVWGSATLRNGGDELAQALWLMGVAPQWDSDSQRVTGFEIVAAEDMHWPRIDVSLRISGLFRDMFANLITLFDDAVRAVAALDEADDINPLAAAARGLRGEARRAATWRIFGGAPGAYGSGTTELIDSGQWLKKDELGQAYLDASSFAYGRDADGIARPEALAARVGGADALIHMQDQRETDVLSGADFADAEGGFAAAAHLLGGDPALYHLDTSRPQSPRVRSLAEEISLTLHARALNADWIAGQMRHGYAGAAALADVVDQLFAFAATSGTVNGAQFDAAFTAYLENDAVREFLAGSNPDALQAMLGRFAEALRRGLWRPRRNSVHAMIGSLHSDADRSASLA